jgi:NAD(P)-dependent dehydrogenase (short-subunit alcohol dehydrogenase family)
VQRTMGVLHSQLLVGKAGLVTGAGRGIGRGIALELARAGADVAVLSRNPTELKSVAAQIRDLGHRAVSITADVQDPRSLTSALHYVWQALPRIEILVNNAGVLTFAKFWEYGEGEYRRMIDTNLTGAFLASQLTARYWLKEGIRGSIVNVASVESEIAYPDQAPYAASKGGLLALTRVLAKELGPAGIRVNAVGPGPIDTPMSQRFRAASEAGVVFGRLGSPSEVGSVVVFLASEMASFVTGTILYVDGGYMLR